MSQSFIKKPAFGPHTALTGLGVLSSEQADQQSATKDSLTCGEPIGDQHAGVVGFSGDPGLLRQCAASGQMEAGEMVEHGVGVECAAADAADPLDIPLPCAVTVGHIPFRQGVSLATFVLAARRWHREAFPEAYELTEEQRALNLANWQALAAVGDGGVLDGTNRTTSGVIGQP